MRWGLEFPEETLEPLKKVSEVFKVSLEMSEEVSNLKQIQKDTLDTFVGGGEGEKFDYFLPDGTRVVIVEQQLLATLKFCWGLDLSEDAPEHPQKTAQPLPQLQPQIQILMGSSVGGDEDAEVDYFLFDGTPVAAEKLIKLWQKLGQPQIEIKLGDILADLESFFSDDVDLEYLALVVQLLNQEAGAQMEQDKVSQTLGMTIEQALDIWTREGKPVIHLGPCENCFDLEQLLFHDDVNPRHLLAIRDWLSRHSFAAEG